MADIPKKHQGLHYARCRRRHNAAELVFAKRWYQQQRLYRTFQSIMNPRGTGPVDVGERDRLVAASVIQWLGSPVGISWLEETLSRARLAEREALEDPEDTE